MKYSLKVGKEPKSKLKWNEITSRLIECYTCLPQLSTFDLKTIKVAFIISSLSHRTMEAPKIKLFILLEILQIIYSIVKKQI